MIKSEEMRIYAHENCNGYDYLSNEEVHEVAIRQKEKMTALGRLAGGIAHDFNNQLMSIIGNATMMQKTDDLVKIKEYAERIINISQGSASLTKKILMFSKNESRINETINLKSIMDNTYNMIESILDKKIEIRYKYGASNKMILGDESQVENLIVTLILNSRDAIKHSFGKIEVGTADTVVFSDMVLSHGETLKPGQYVTIYVEDNGAGINECDMLKIFEPYFTTKTKLSGTGLGLSVAFGTVKSHAGFINVKSKVGIGTRFEIFLPVYSKKQSAKVSNKVVEIKSNLIMLVDDDPNVLGVEKELIEDLGYNVIKFNKPLEALDYYKKHSKKIAFSVIDLSMPVMTGKQLYDEMQKIYNKSKALFITGYANQTDCEELLSEGEIIIQKPFTYEALSAQIAKIYL
jgi:nitrogen-specific signal transduction histidine kinase